MKTAKYTRGTKVTAMYGWQKIQGTVKERSGVVSNTEPYYIKEYRYTIDDGNGNIYFGIKEDDIKEARSKAASDEFIITISEITEYLAELQEYVEDHMNFDPDTLNWGHVGSAQSLACSLKDLVDIKNGNVA